MGLGQTNSYVTDLYVTLPIKKTNVLENQKKYTPILPNTLISVYPGDKKWRVDIPISRKTAVEIAELTFVTIFLLLLLMCLLGK